MMIYRTEGAHFHHYLRDSESEMNFLNVATYLPLLALWYSQHLCHLYLIIKSIARRRRAKFLQKLSLIHVKMISTWLYIEAVENCWHTQSSWFQDFGQELGGSIVLNKVAPGSHYTEPILYWVSQGRKPSESSSTQDEAILSGRDFLLGKMRPGLDFYIRLTV